MNKNKKIIITPVTYSVCLKGDNPLFGASAIHISVEDEAAGPFLKITSFQEDLEPGTVTLDFDEWVELVKIGNMLLKEYEGERQ